MQTTSRAWASRWCATSPVSPLLHGPRGCPCCPRQCAVLLAQAGGGRGRESVPWNGPILPMSPLPHCLLPPGPRVFVALPSLLQLCCPAGGPGPSGGEHPPAQPAGPGSAGHQGNSVARGVQALVLSSSGLMAALVLKMSAQSSRAFFRCKNNSLRPKASNCLRSPSGPGPRAASHSPSS